MNVCILMGSPRKEGNTAALLKPFCEELQKGGATIEVHWLYELEIRPCLACRACQKDWTIFGCAQKDDGQMLFDRLMAADLIVFATPIYSWYCTPPVKALMDRMVYGLNNITAQKKVPPSGRERPLPSLPPAATHRKRGQTSLKRVCAATVSTRLFGISAATPSGIWAMTTSLWMRKKSPAPENLRKTLWRV